MSQQNEALRAAQVDPLEAADRIRDEADFGPGDIVPTAGEPREVYLPFPVADGEDSMLADDPQNPRNEVPRFDRPGVGGNSAPGQGDGKD